VKAHAPSRNAGFICLLLFVLGMVGHFVPLGHAPYVGAMLTVLNQIDVYLLMVGYALLLLAVYIL
jgi:hypothetical protein